MERSEADERRTAFGAWLGGLLGGMSDPKTYPKFEELIPPPDEAAETAPEPDGKPEPEAEAVGAKLWIMYLNSKP
jgi:hypothetical protein